MPDALWNDLAFLAGSGALQIGATTDIPGVRLEHVSVNVLMTKRLRASTKVIPVATKPVFATAGSRGAGQFH